MMNGISEKISRKKKVFYIRTTLKRAIHVELYIVLLIFVY